MIKSLLRKLISPSPKKPTTEEIFTNIYQSNKWGGMQGEFCSGDGSTDTQVVSAYAKMIAEKATEEGFLGLKFVDLGCGDFRVGQQLLPLCSHYTGVDIVQPLIKHHQELYENETTHFIHLNIIKDELPKGDVCFIRQVLQHLSNEQILKILEKLNQYQWVFITEHYPTENADIKPNLDRPHGAGIRVEQNSGVYLAKPPFNLPDHCLTKVLEVPGKGMPKDADQGVISSFLYKPIH